MFRRLWDFGQQSRYDRFRLKLWNNIKAITLSALTADPQIGETMMEEQIFRIIEKCKNLRNGIKVEQKVF